MNILEIKRNDHSIIQTAVNRFNDALLINNAPAADFLVREHFPLLLQGFEAFQKTVCTIIDDMTAFKSTVNLAVRNDGPSK